MKFWANTATVRLVHLDERALIEEEVDALAGRELALLVLLLDGTRRPGVGNFGNPTFQVGKLAGSRMDIDVLEGGIGGHIREPSLALVPGLLEVARIRAAVAGSPIRDVVVLDRVDSTNAEVARRGQPWCAVLAEHQEGGRGRLGRSWEEVPGAGLAISILLPVPHMQVGWLPLVTALAARSALLDVADFTAELKWPNDLLDPVTGRKLAGILCELIGGAVVVGTGINVDHTAAQLPVETATSLALVGRAAVDRADLAASYLRHLAQEHAALTAGGAPAAARFPAYRQACATIGRVADVTTHEGRVERVLVEGVDDDGRLRILGPAGAATVTAGDVRHVRAARPR